MFYPIGSNSPLGYLPSLKSGRGWSRSTQIILPEFFLVPVATRNQLLSEKNQKLLMRATFISNLAAHVSGSYNYIHDKLTFNKSPTGFCT